MVRVVCCDLRNNAVSTSEQSVPLTVDERWRFESASPSVPFLSASRVNKALNFSTR